MKKIISAMLLCALLLTLCSCSVKVLDKNQATTTPTTVDNFPTDEEGNPQVPLDAQISPEEAQKICREALGISEEQMLSPFVHIGEYGDPVESCYSVQFATLEKDYEFVVSAVTGKILYRSDKVEQTQPAEGSAND